jgi:aspartyl protease
VPFPISTLLIGLGLIGWVETALPAESLDRKNDRVPKIDAPSTLDTPGGVVPTVRAGDLLFAAVTINGSPAGWWLVDTGATMCEFDLETASRLHLKRSTRYRLITRPKTRGEPVVFVEASDLLVGTIQCGPLVMLAHPLVPALRLSKSPAKWPGGFDKTGLLGMNLLVAKRALINWRKQQVYLNPDDQQVKSKADYEAEGYTAVPLNITPSRQVQVDGTLGRNHYQFCLDTGTPRTTIEQSVVDQGGLKSRLTNSVVRSPMNEFPDSKISQVIGTQFRLGDYDLSSRKILAGSLHLTKSDRGDIWAGLIGADVLWDYDAVIDLGSNMLYLRRKTD